MSENFLFSSLLMAILISGISGLFLFDNVFAQDLNNHNSDYLKKQQELEQKKAELEIQREHFEEKQLKKLNEFEEKLKEIKEKLKNKIEKSISDERISQKFKAIDDKLTKKSEEIQQKLAAKGDKLDLRTRSILYSINDGQYMGEKITSDDYVETYELVFDSVDASLINDDSQTSSLTGKMTFMTYDKSTSDLKLELNECQITVDGVVFNCGFGKARSISSGYSNVKDSLIIIAFLEDSTLEKIHTTLKIFLNANIQINDIDRSKVAILEPQSKISNLWFLNGTATLSKMISISENISSDDND